MGEFLADLKSVVSLGAIGEVALKVRENDLLGLAGQLAYFFLLSFFPFLIFLVALAGIALDGPEAAVRSLISYTEGFLPRDAAALLVDYVNRTLRGASASVLVFGIVTTLWLGSASSIAIAKAANRAYGIEESRPFWRLRGTALLLALGFTLLVAALTLVIFEAEVYIRGTGGPPNDTFLLLWGVGRWALAFLTVTLALSVLYYLAPDAELPFKWITPGGFLAAVLMFASSAVLSFYVSAFGNYDRIYGQLGAVIVFMLWLYVTGLTVLIGVEVNAVLARRAERRKGIEIVQSGRPASKDGAGCREEEPW